MSLLAIVLVLLVEQVRPLPVEQWLRAPLARIAGLFEDKFNEGGVASGRIAWALLVGLLVGGCVLLHLALVALSPFVAFLFSVGVLYLTMGMRHESHYFTDIHAALRLGELDRARTQLSEWTGRDCSALSESDTVRQAIEQALVAAHRNVFGVVFWFLVLPGPTGAVLYRLASFLDRAWGARQDEEIGRFGQAARQAFQWIDWLPVRLTAVSFSVVGNFEDAILCWRTQAGQCERPSSGILLSSGGGALGVRLGAPRQEAGRFVDRPELGCGEEARVEFMQGTVGLIWRALCLCLLVLALIGIAGWVAP